jgi:Ni/Fe-hydrogenase subunit HybB-like protein
MAAIQTMRQRPGLAIVFLVLAVVFIVAAVGVVMRYALGLGAVTNLSDPVPWGLWIGFDILVGVALASGGFVAAFMAYVTRVDRYHVHVRGAILAAFLGYVFVIAALVLDLGRPWSLWNFFVTPNPHSVMAEVGWCVILYTLVLTLEFSPVVFRRFNIPAPLRLINRIFIVLVIAGIVLSTLHQSSLGSLYLIMPTKLHALWYSPLLPIYFLMTAVAVGLCILIIESTFLIKDPASPVRRINVPRLGEYCSIVLLAYLGLRLGELLVKGNLTTLRAGTGLEFPAFLIEICIGFLLPAILFLLPGIQRMARGPFWVAWMVVLGVVLNRLNVAVIGLMAHNGTVYWPSFWEITITVALIAAEVLIFIWLMIYLVLPDEKQDEQEHKEASAAVAS